MRSPDKSALHRYDVSDWIFSVLSSSKDEASPKNGGDDFSGEAFSIVEAVAARFCRGDEFGGFDGPFAVWVEYTKVGVSADPNESFRRGYPEKSCGLCGEKVCEVGEVEIFSSRGGPKRRKEELVGADQRSGESS